MLESNSHLKIRAADDVMEKHFWKPESSPWQQDALVTTMVAQNTRAAFSLDSSLFGLFTFTQSHFVPVRLHESSKS